MTDFAELGVSERLVGMLKAMGIVTPTPVQEETIPIVIRGRDVISQAQTGTGKTLAFVLPMLDKIDTSLPYVQGLILTPTRELAIQITAEIKKLLDPRGDIKVLAVYGGQDVEAQLFKLKSNIHLVIATPGRLLDHMRRETITLGGVSMLVLDEADQMLHMGFLKEVEEILHQTPYKKQAMLFSATMPHTIREMAGRILRNPEHVTVKSERVTVKDIRQWVVETTDREKQATLVKLLEETQPYLSIIFCRTKTRAKTLNEALQEMGYSSDELHGDLSQGKREKVMKQFRDARLQLLVATDVAARGLDVEGITHVFNYDVPQDVDSYIHRIGRTGRAGESGLAITLIAPKDRRELADIENGIEMAMERRSEEGKSLGGGGLENTRTGGGLGRTGGGAGRTRGISAGQAKGRSISASKARGGDKSYGAGGRGDNRRGGAAKPGPGNRSMTGEWQNRGQSRDAAAKGKPVRGTGPASEASDEAIGFTFGERGDRGASSGGRSAAGRKPDARGFGRSGAGGPVRRKAEDQGFSGRPGSGAGRSSGQSGRPSAGGAGGRKSSDERGFGRPAGGGSFGRPADERGGRPSTGGTTRRNSAERNAERAAAAASFGRKPEERGGFGRSGSGGGNAKAGRKPEQRGGGGFGGGGRSSGPKSGGGAGGFKGSKGPSGGSRGGGRGSSRGR